MTGTPVANKPEDLWTQYFFLDDGEALGSTFDDFRARFCLATGGYTRIEDLRERLKPLSLRREKEGSVSLPNKSTTRIPIHLEGQQLGMSDELRRNLAVLIRNMSGEEILARAEDILTRLVRLAQLASNPGLIDSSYDEVPAKYYAIDKLLPIYLAEPEDKVIIWTSFVPNISTLKSRLAPFNPVCIHGRLDSKAKQRSIRAFKTDPSARVLLANPAAAREGLTLTQAKTAIYLDRTFNLVDYLQSQDRIHRLSQTKPCEIILLIASETIDEFIDFSLEQKHRLAKYTQGDTNEIELSDLALEKPELLRALIGQTAVDQISS